jgi:hypothetical protein
MELRVNLVAPDATIDPTVQFRWLSETTNPDDESSWRTANFDNDGVFRFDLRQADTLTGKLCLKPNQWPDSSIERLRFNAAVDKELEVSGVK